jgi:hypothetical protein
MPPSSPPGLRSGGDGVWLESAAGPKKGRASPQGRDAAALSPRLRRPAVGGGALGSPRRERMNSPLEMPPSPSGSGVSGDAPADRAGERRTQDRWACELVHTMVDALPGPACLSSARAAPGYSVLRAAREGARGQSGGSDFDVSGSTC